MPSVGLSLSCHRGHQQSTGSEPESIWLSHTLSFLNMALVLQLPFSLPAVFRVGDKGQPCLGCSGRERGLAGQTGSLALSKHAPSLPSLWGLRLGVEPRRVGSRSGSRPVRGPGPPAAGGGQGCGCWLSEGRRAIHNISYLQLARLPQVSEEAFLPSYLPD